MSSYLNLLSEFMSKFNNAGFNGCCDDFRTIVENIDGPWPRKDNYFRILYLMYIGLADAKINIPKGEFDIVGECADISHQIKFEKDIYGPYEANKDDRPYFDFKINIKKMQLHKCTDYLPQGPEGSICDSLENLRKRKFQRIGNVWHAQWLFKHQEFIPDDWIKIIDLGGCIIFPGVDVVSKGYPNSSDINVYYPVIRRPTNRVGNIELFFYRTGDFCINKKNHFIATVGPNHEKVFFDPIKRTMIKTRRYK